MKTLLTSGYVNQQGTGQEIKAFTVQALICFDSPTQIVNAGKVELGSNITRQQIESHDPYIDSAPLTAWPLKPSE